MVVIVITVGSLVTTCTTPASSLSQEQIVVGKTEPLPIGVDVGVVVLTRLASEEQRSRHRTY